MRNKYFWPVLALLMALAITWQADPFGQTQTNPIKQMDTQVKDDSKQAKPIQLALANEALLPKPEANTILWQVDKAGSKTSYLLGSMHVGKEPNALSNLVSAVSERTNQLVVESNIDELTAEHPEVLTAFAQKMQGNAKQDLGQERFNRVVALISEKEGASKEQLAQVKPWVLWQSMQMVFFPDDLSAKSGIDMYLLNAAKQQHKRIVHLESVVDAAAYMEELPVSYIQESIDVQLSFPKADMMKVASDTYHAYVDNNPERIFDLLNQENQKSNAKLSPANRAIGNEWMFNRLLKNRNHQWQAPLIQALEQDSNLVVVGAAHLFGPDGVIQLLRQSGYTVTPIFNQQALTKKEAA